MCSLNVFLDIHLSVPSKFESLMGPRKSRCDITNGTSQGWIYPYLIVVISCPHNQSCQHQIVTKTSNMLTI